jgi:hypothetical protein
MPLIARGLFLALEAVRDFCKQAVTLRIPVSRHLECYQDVSTVTHSLSVLAKRTKLPGSGLFPSAVHPAA